MEKGGFTFFSISSNKNIQVEAISFFSSVLMDQECKKQFSVIFTKVRFKTDRKSFLLIEKSISEINLLFCIIMHETEEWSNDFIFKMGHLFENSVCYFVQV
jgi:hypothetical protein